MVPQDLSDCRYNIEVTLPRMLYGHVVYGKALWVVAAAEIEGNQMSFGRGNKPRRSIRHDEIAFVSHSHDDQQVRVDLYLALTT